MEEGCSVRLYHGALSNRQKLLPERVEKLSDDDVMTIIKNKVFVKQYIQGL